MGLFKSGNRAFFPGFNKTMTTALFIDLSKVLDWKDNIQDLVLQVLNVVHVLVSTVYSGIHFGFHSFNARTQGFEINFNVGCDFGHCLGQAPVQHLCEFGKDECHVQ